MATQPAKSTETTLSSRSTLFAYSNAEDGDGQVAAEVGDETNEEDVQIFPFPPELRNMIYKAYLERSNPEHVHGGKDARKAKGWNGDSRFWAPFSLYYRDVIRADEFGRSRKICVHRCLENPKPALWKVDGQVGVEAEKLHFSEHMRLDLWHPIYHKKLQRGLDLWQKNTQSLYLASIKKLHLDISFNIHSMPSRPTLRHPDDPLFRI
jgi:hypothetical protein